MSSKTQTRIRMTMYVAMLLVALLLEGPAFGALNVRYVPSLMPVVVACIAMWEGTENGCIFGLVGGLLRAWSMQLGMYGAWCIVVLTLVGAVAGLVTERFLLRGIKTVLCISGAALLLTNGLFVIFLSIGGTLPGDAFFTLFLPEGILSMVIGAVFYPIIASISKIGGFHG